MTLSACKQRLRALVRREDGMALPVALFAMIASMALAGSAVVATMDVQRGAHRDDSSKRAIAAADAGANIARARQTRYAYVLNEKNPCLRMGAGGVLERAPAELVGPQAWCPAISGSVNDASYVYRVSPVGVECGEQELCIVSTGTADSVSRRIEVAYDRSNPFGNTQENESWKTELDKKINELEEALEKAREEGDVTKIKELEEQLTIVREEEAAKIHLEGFVGREGIVLSGNADIRVGVGTNGNLETSGNATICGDIRHGVGKSWLASANAHQCSGYDVTEGNYVLPSVSSFMPLNIATVNSNFRLVTCSQSRTPTGCQSDTLTGGNWSSNYPFNSSKREITLAGNSTLTIGGGDYWLCGMSFSGNSQLIIAKGAKVRFFFDTPEHCGGNGNQLSFSGNNQIVATGYQPSLGQFELPGFYFLGSTSGTSSLSLSGNSTVTNEMIIYAPDTYLNISGNATWKGIIAGRRIVMSGNGHVEQDAGFQVPPELNPQPTESSETIKKLEEEIEHWESGGEVSEQELKEKQEKLQQLQEEEERKTNRAPIYFTPQAYFECTGVPGPGDPPNANC
ncbi:MAG TPA: hypothetical protein VEB65_08750 [Solirubrobacterales bacterium]|nr:hypothetical protein [Solirubrobacterales bacterium]